MNEINKDETIISKLKEKKTNLIFGYKDKLEIKYKKLHNLKTPLEKNQISKFFNKTSFIKKEKNQTPHINLNQTNSIFKNIKSNNINILDKNKFNSSFGIKKNINKISSNFFLIKLKESKYFSPMNRNKNQEIFHSPSLNKPKTMREKILMGNNSSYKNSQHFYDISFIKNISDINDNKNQNNIDNHLNKSNSQKSFKIRQKFFYNRNNNQKIFFNKSFQDLNKNMKNSISNNKSTSMSSIPIKELNPNISDSKGNEILQLKRMHGIDLRINELLKKNNKDNELKEKDNKIKRQKYLQQLAQFYDNLPSLMMKKKLDKDLIKPNKKVKYEDFGQNFYSPIKIIKKEENQKDEFDKLIQSNPIIKYIFLQKILNSLVHRVNLFGENNDNLVINSNTTTKLNEEIQDFITYGYEFIPEDFLKNKNIESPKDLIKDEEFIKIILKTKSSIDNAINNNEKEKELSQMKAEFDLYTDTGIKINSKHLDKGSNANLMNKFLEMQNKKNKMAKKSRFLFKKININKIENNNNKLLLNKSTNYDYNNKSNDYSLEKSEEKNSKTNNNINNDNNLLSQLFNILYEDINNLDDIIKKDKLDNEKRNIMKHKEKFWRRLLQKNDNNEIIYYIKKKKRRIRSGEKSNKKIKVILNDNYEFEPIENRKIKSGKRYMESKIDIDSEKDDNEDKAIIKLNKNRKDISTYNVYYKNNIIKKEKKILIDKKRQNINLRKKTEKVTQILENIPETNDIFDSKEENKKKENKISKNYYYYRKRAHLKSLKRDDKNREEKEISKDNKNENSIENKSDISKDKKNDDSYYTNLHLEDILNKKNEKNKIKMKKKEEKKDKEKNILKNNTFKQYLLQYQNNIHAKNNEKIISSLLEAENENKKSLKNIKNEIKKEEIKEKREEEEEDKKENRILSTRKESKIYFKDMGGKSLEDVEKKKIELLYRFKHDIKYKISKGGIGSNEMENFKEFQEKINKLKDRYKEYDINSYIKEMEKFFQSFKDELENNEKKKIEEDRINKYLRQFQEDYYFKQFYKNLQENILFKVVNFSQINHINTLNDWQHKAN